MPTCQVLATHPACSPDRRGVTSGPTKAGWSRSRAVRAFRELVEAVARPRPTTSSSAAHRAVLVTTRATSGTKHTQLRTLLVSWSQALAAHRSSFQTAIVRRTSGTAPRSDRRAVRDGRPSRWIELRVVCNGRSGW